MSGDWIKLLVIQEILNTHMLDLARITNLMHLVSNVPRGQNIAEFGVYVGNTALLMSMLNEDPLWLYDSFEGLPKPDPGSNEHFEKGKLKSEIKDVLTNFDLARRPRPYRIVKSWFEQIDPNDLPNNFSFVHLDADFYDGTIAVLEHVYPRMIPGGVILIDDYGWDGLPGVKKAVDRFMGNRVEIVQPLNVGPQAGQAVIRKWSPRNSE